VAQARAHPAGGQADPVDGFGEGVAIHESWVLVGASRDSINGGEAGAARVTFGLRTWF